MVYKEVIYEEMKNYGLFALLAEIGGKRGKKLGNLYRALSRSQHISLANLLKSVGLEPRAESLKMAERMSEESEKFEKLWEEGLKKGEKRISVNFRFLSVIKRNMAEILEFPEDFQALYVCPVCGYITKDEVPKACPLCNAPGDSFEKF